MGQDGDIVLVDPVSGTRATIIGGPAPRDWGPHFSRDGTRLAFTRLSAVGDGDDSGVWVADTDVATSSSWRQTGSSKPMWSIGHPTVAQ